MTYTRSNESVVFGNVLENVDSSGNVENQGGFVCGEIDITEYDAPEVISAASLGLAHIYGATFWQTENAEHEFHSVVVSSNGQTVTVTIDDVGSGTEAGADDVGTVGFLAFGERRGSGANS